MQEQQLIESHIKALTIFNANNTMMSTAECAKFLKISVGTVKTRINKKTIIGVFQDGKYHIPKLQFVDKLVATFLNSNNNIDSVTIVSEEDKIAQGIESYFKEKIFPTA